MITEISGLFQKSQIIPNYEILPKTSKGMHLNTERILQFPELLLKQRGYGSGQPNLPEVHPSATRPSYRKTRRIPPSFYPVRNNAPLLYGGVRFYNNSGGV